MVGFNTKSRRARRLQERKRAKFWDKYGDPVRVTLIAIGAIGGATLVAKMAFG